MGGFELRQADFMNKHGAITNGMEFVGISEETKFLHYIAPNNPCRDLGEYAIFSDAVKRTDGLDGYEPRAIVSPKEFCPAAYLRFRPRVDVYFVYPKIELIGLVEPGSFWISTSELDVEAVRYLRQFISNSRNLISAFKE